MVVPIALQRTVTGIMQESNSAPLKTSVMCTLATCLAPSATASWRPTFGAWCRGLAPAWAISSANP